MAQLYAWANPEFLLKKMSLEQILFYHEQGWKAQKLKARIMTAKFSYLLAGEPEPKEPGEVSDFDEDAILKAHPELKTKGVVTL